MTAIKTYSVAEQFDSVQGEGIYVGTPMRFVRFTGCSVGKKICHHCDTDFDSQFPWRGGGEFTAWELVNTELTHLCFTGGEPLNIDLVPFYEATADKVFHVETSGTVEPAWLKLRAYRDRTHVCVSPKPGYMGSMIEMADEVKIIVGGLGNGPGWPTPEDGIRWAEQGKVVFLQPCNKKYEPDMLALKATQEWVMRFPNHFRLSVQLHKYLNVR